MRELTIEELEKKAKKYRKEITELVYKTKKGHIGGCFSCIDILNVLYNGGILKYNPSNADWEQRDRFILSKGHSTLALDVVLEDVGFISKTELDFFGQDGSYLGAHSDMHVNGIEVNSGSLGNGLGIGLGMAISTQLDNQDIKIIVLTGDGECYEGSIWEAALYAGQCKTDNLIWIIDRNGQCVLNFTENINKLEPLDEKIRSFGWNVLTVNGHDYKQLRGLKTQIECNRGKPLCIIADTVKGKGVSFMEKKLEWHHKALTEEEFRLALDEIDS